MSMSTPRAKRLSGGQALEFQVLRQIIETVNSTLELRGVFEEILTLVSRVTAADACALYLLEETPPALVLQAAQPSHPERVGRVTLQVGEGFAGWVAQERRAVAIGRRAFEDARFTPVPLSPEDRYEAFLSVPIIARDRLVGVINVQHRAPHRYGAEIVALVETIGRLVGGAIANARLYAAARHRRRALETLARVSEAAVSERYLDEILQLIVTVTAELMGSKICSLMLLDETRQVLVIKATQTLSPAYRNKPPIKVGQSISGQAVQERRPISVLDVTRNHGYRYPEIARREGLCSLLSVPMLMQERPIGVINCYTSQEHRFSDDEIRVLSTIANQAAAVIERTRLLDEAVSAREALATRKLVEQAKGLLMTATRVTEAQAFRLLQTQSMEKRKSMRHVAEAVILAHALKEAS